MPLRFKSGAEAAKFLRVVIELEGAEGAEEALKALEEAGTHAAEEIDRDWAKVGQRMEELSGKAAQVGGVLTQNVTMPIMALGAAATAMAFNVLQSEEAIAKLSREGQASARALQAAWDDLTGEFEDLKITVAESVMPTLTLLINDALIPLLETVSDLAEAWGNQSDAAKNSQLAMLGIAAAVGPVMQSLGQIGQSVGASIIIWDALKKSTIGARLAAITPLPVLAAGAIVAAGPVLYGAITPEDYTGARTRATPGEPPPEWMQRQMEAEGGGRAPFWGHLGPPDIFDLKAGPPVPEDYRYNQIVAQSRAFEAARIAAMVGAITGGGGGGAVAPSGLLGGFGGGGYINQFAGQIDPFLTQMNVLAEQGAVTYTPPVAPGISGMAGWSDFDKTAYARFGVTPGDRAVSSFLEGPGPNWYDNLMRNDFLMSAGGQLAGTLAGGGKIGWGQGLGLVGSAFGPIGGAAGSLIGGLLDRGKQRGDTPQNPLHVKVINPGDLATAMLNITKTLLGQVGAVGLDKLVQQVHDQSLARNLT